MGNVVIRAENLSKRYRIGEGVQYQTFRDSVARTAQRAARRVANWRGNGEQTRQDAHIWALRDVSFEVRQGEVLGVIGRNGAGKSTLLKILSRITKPTTGEVRVRGRVGSLLEVGTGFHPELTGRENVYLNGAVLGMRKQEIDRRFDEIVAFAEIERFLDTPVKHYSSGMYMRLGFAVAAHLEPEILLVDEVLAVGDAAFQKKCLGKMGDVANQGRTIIFVSHNMVAIEAICEKAIWLHEGKFWEAGPARGITSAYLKTSFSGLKQQCWNDRQAAPGNDDIRLKKVAVYPTGEPSLDAITVRDPITIEIEYWNLKPGARMNINLQLYNEQGILVFEAGPIREPIWRPLTVGLYRDSCQVPGQLLNDGAYRVAIYAVLEQGISLFQADDLLIFDVQDVPDFRAGWNGEWQGVVRPILEWQREAIGQPSERDVQ